MKFLLDTNICIYIIKNSPASVVKKFHSLLIGDVGISSVTLAELEYGVNESAHKEKNQEALYNFILPLEIIDFDAKAARTYGMIRADLEKKRKPIGCMDMMIGAQALAMNVILVTNNEKEFIRIKDLKVENWISIS